MEKVRKLVPEEEERKLDLHTYWKIFWRKKHFFLVPIALSIVIAVLGVKQITPIYESFTLMSVEDQNILSRTMGRYVTAVEERDRLRIQQYRAMIETKLMSRSFLEQVVRDLNLHNSFEMRQGSDEGTGTATGIPAEELVIRRLVGLMREKIGIQNAMPGFFRVSVFDTDPSTAYILASRISEKYVETVKQEQVMGLRQAGAFSDEQLAIYKEKLETSEKEMARVRRDMMDTDVESNPVNSANIHIAEARKRSISAQIGNSEMSLKRVRERLQSVFGLIPATERIGDDETIKTLEDQVFAFGDERLLEEIGSEQETPGENMELMRLWDELRRRIGVIVDEEYEEFSSELRPLITEYYAQRYFIDYHRFRERRLTVYIDQFRQNMESRPMLEREFNRLTHEVETNRAIYQAFIESKTSAQISEAVQSTNLGVRINIVEKAERSLTPVKPDKIKIILLALIFGIASGLGAILITEYMDDSFRSVDEVERILKIPVLGTVPKTVSHFTWERKKQGKMVLLWIVGLFLFVSIVSGALYIYARSLKATSIGVELHEK
ncbi:MAG TPA: GNVR domain-containing protein [Patescibacteria group bacterium]|nr:GNVR domain-containing protein [Patescibacteria group bacterium]